MEDDIINFDIRKYRDNLRFKNDKIWDFCRKKWIVINPEEIVRQTMCEYLNKEKEIPYSLMQTETGLRYHQLKKRADILVFNRNAEPLILVECKSFNIKMTEKVLEQALVYHSQVKSKYLALTNGHQVVIYKRNKNTLESLDDLPKFNQL